jgi:hypothetical protein
MNCSARRHDAPVFAQERAKRQGPMGRCLLLDRDADPERRMAVLDKGRKSLAKPAGTGKQIDNAESGRQIRLLTISFSRCILGSRDENQDGM